MSEDIYATSLALMLARAVGVLERNADAAERSAGAMERIAVAAERMLLSPSTTDTPRSRRKAKNDTPATEGAPDTALVANDSSPAEAPVNIDDDNAMRAHAGERISQLVAHATEIGCPMADIEEVVADNTGSADPEALDLTTLSQIIVGLTRLIKGHGPAPEESEADKQLRAEALGQIRTLTQRAAATDEGLAATIAIMRNHAGGDGDVDRLELGKLQALLAAMQTTAGSAPAPVS